MTVKADEGPMRAMWTNLRGTAENPYLLSCDGGFLRLLMEQMTRSDRLWMELNLRRPPYIWVRWR
jgi:hypothetical protein